ncbi:hypothetical protein [Granulicatella seriolae]|uniref:Uncharacterized protein n=1 Tax=Granulicatella seriolae TaxID=2967226 RepID=A0ABT1WLT0_9LACT|nr:hypothetical protein [Granulicatella seriolae]
MSKPFAGWIEYKSKEEREKELDAYRQKLFPDDGQGQETTQKLLAEHFPKEDDKVRFMVYLQVKEALMEDPDLSLEQIGRRHPLVKLLKKSSDLDLMRMLVKQSLETSKENE